MFIKNFAKIVAPLTALTGNDDWEWGPKQVKAMDLIKEGIRNAPCLRPINYEWDVYLVVDTSYMAVGWYIYQIDPNDEDTVYFCYFSLRTLNDREA